jgi:membrane associated rhomboid family serine protease
MGIYDREYYQENELRPLRPWDKRSMVTLLIIANVVLYFANFLLTAPPSNALTNALSLKPESLYSPLKWWQFLTYGFVHDPGGIGHILFNMISLYFLGRSVEDRLGKAEFARFYLFTIVLCGLVWACIHQGSSGLIGASGATTAVAMLFVFYFPQATLMLYGVLPVKAWVIGILIVAGNVFQPTGVGASNVAYDVHLVGAAFAAVYCFGKLNFGFLGSFWSDVSGSLKRKKSGLKIHRPDSKKATPRPDKDALEMDRILDKISSKGVDGLTSRERKFMERYSKQMRKKRGTD